MLQQQKAAWTECTCAGAAHKHSSLVSCCCEDFLVPFSFAPCVCANCGAPDDPSPDGAKLKNCSFCKAAKYCGRECQVKHWKKHKVQCTGPLNERGESEAMVKKRSKTGKGVAAGEADVGVADVEVAEGAVAKGKNGKKGKKGKNGRGKKK